MMHIVKLNTRRRSIKRSLVRFYKNFYTCLQIRSRMGQKLFIDSSSSCGDDDDDKAMTV